ncbi:MAG: 50S ribosomal protein L29 [Myxococcales bacterium]|nr:50S ribosomal protein L29 [Myxococcales bacterium]
MKAAEVREKSTDELRSLEKDLAVQLWQARFDNHTNRLDDTAKIDHLRRDIARVKTTLTQRERGEVVKEKAEAKPAKAKAPKAPKAEAATAETAEGADKPAKTTKKSAKSASKAK